MNRLTYIGIDPPPEVTPSAVLEEGAREGERDWGTDLYGEGLKLKGKRERRGWREEVNKVIGEESGEDVKGLLDWKGGKSKVEVFMGRLPWDAAGVEDSKR